MEQVLKHKDHFGTQRIMHIMMNNIGESTFSYNSGYTSMYQPQGYTTCYNGNASYENCYNGNASYENYHMCPMNCICCLNYQLGKSCSCSTTKETVSTQTDGVDFLRLNVNTENYWTRGTFAHTMLQKYVNNVINKYNLKSMKDLAFGRAVMDVVTNFPDLGASEDVRSKITTRITKAIRWRTFSAKRRIKKVSSIRNMKSDRQAYDAITSDTSEDSNTSSIPTTVDVNAPGCNADNPMSTDNDDKYVDNSYSEDEAMSPIIPFMSLEHFQKRQEDSYTYNKDGNLPNIPLTIKESVNAGIRHKAILYTDQSNINSFKTITPSPSRQVNNIPSIGQFL